MSEGVLDASARDWFGIGLGVGFLVVMSYLVLLQQKKDFDHGWIGLMLLLIIIFFLVAFSFLVAASTPGYGIKIAVAVVDAFVLIGSKLLAPDFLIYLADNGERESLGEQLARRQGAPSKNIAQGPALGASP